MKKILHLLLVYLTVLQVSAQTKKVGGYFTNWSVYSRKFGVANLPTDKVNQMTQAFMFPFLVNGTLKVGDEVLYRGTSKMAVILTCRNFVDDNGVARTTGVASTDFYADIENTLGSVARYGSPSWLNGTTKSEQIASWKALADDKKPGVLGQFVQVKSKGVETVASLGGWTLAQHFPYIANDIRAREAFAQAVNDFAVDFKFDAIDFDWEFPVSGGTDGSENLGSLPVPSQPHFAQDPMNMVMLCKAVKNALGSTKKLTIATSQNPHTVQNMYIFPGNKSTWAGQTYKGYDGSDLTNWVDFFYTMTYDYGGAWLSSTSHQAPLYNSNVAIDPDKDMSASAFINKLVDELGVPANRVMMGVPFYGRGWGRVAAGPKGDGLYQPSSQGTERLLGSWDDTAGENSAAFDYGDLKDGKARNLHQYIKDGVGTGNNGFIEYWDDVCKVPYVYNPSTGDFISYDNPRSIAEKTKFAMSKGLAGVFTWEFSQDDRALSLISAMAENAQLYDVKVSGSVTAASGSGIAGVTVNLTGGATKSVTTGSDGAYTFTVNALKNYTVSFSKSGYTLLPAQIAMSMLSKDSVINVVGSSAAYSISGKVTLGGTPVNDMELELKSGTKTIGKVTSGADGTYTFNNVPGDFNYQVIPHSPYYTVSPAGGYSYTALSSNKTNQNIVVDYAPYTISGTVTNKSGDAIPGAKIILSGGATGTFQTGADGTYTIPGLAAKSNYKLSIQLDNIFYSAFTVTKSTLAQNETVNFTEYPGIAVFGYVKNGTTPSSGTTVAMTNEWDAAWSYSHSTTTDASGFYSFVLPESVKSLKTFVLKPSVGTWFPKDITSILLNSSLRADFNSQEVTIDLAMTQPAAVTTFTNASGKVTLEATASVGTGSIASVKFEVDGKVLTATNTTGNTYAAEWIPSAVFTDYTIKVTATTDTGAKSTVSKTVYVDCNTNCPNIKPVINLVSPMAGSETQTSFSVVNISADVTDTDGTINTVAFKIDGSVVTPVKAGNTYSYNFTPTSHKTYTIEISATDNSSETSIVSKNYAIRRPSTFTPMPDVAIVGYWHNWAGEFAPFIPLRDLVNSKYTIIDVSFAMQKSTAEDHIAVFTPDASFYPNEQTFKDEVQLLKNAGKVVLLSFGGEKGHFSLESLAEKEAFISSVKGLIDTYGFDGIDIDFEGAATKFGETSTSLEYATLTSARSKYLIDALKELVAYYGDPFVLTFAPELYYVQVGYSTYPGEASGDFLPILYNLRDEMDLLHVQYYNYGSEWWMGSAKQPTYSAELVTQELELLLTGFTLGNTGNRFPAIAPSKLAVGLPCTCSAAGLPNINDYNVPIDEMIAGLEYLRTGIKPSGFGYTTKGTYEPIRGMMTWSINWDATTDCSHTPYDFANRYFAYFDGLSNAKPVVSITSPAVNATLSTGTIPITASASDTDGTVSKVDFYANSVKVGTASVAPYSFNWAVSVAGTYKLYAIATDNLGKEGKSAEIEVQVIVPGSPVVSLSSPVANAQILPEETLKLIATATDSDGTIAKVEFYDGTTKLGEDTTSPYEFTWNGATPGVHEITAKATDNVGKNTTTAKTSITVFAYYTISGSVKKEDGSAMKGVNLSLIGNSKIVNAETDVNGVYSISNVLSFKNYTIKASTSSANEFTPEQLSITNLSGNQTNVNFVLNEGVYVHGYVKNGTIPVSGASVQVTLQWTSNSAPYLSQRVTTNAEGYYRYMISDGYVGGAGGNVIVNSWENNNTAYYPSDGYVYKSFTKVERCDFNAQANSITVDILTASPIDVASGSTVLLQANATIGSGNIETVSFSIDNQTILATLDGTIWKANWTPSALDADYTLSVKATGEGISNTVAKSIRVNCTGIGCANKNPLISVLAPTASVGQQASFVAVPVTVSVTDPDGTVSTVKIKVDGVEKTVTASGNTYSCSFTPSAYKKYVIAVEATDNAGGTASLTKDYTVRQPSTFVSFPDKCITGYWHNWENTSAPFMPLRDVLNTKFNVAIVSFIETVNSDGYTPVFEPLGNRYATHAAFKADVKILQDAGIPVLISIGGERGHVQLSTDQQKKTFVNGVIAICEEYGFDGIDIDYEGNSMKAFEPGPSSLEYSSITDPDLKYGIDAIREIHAYFGDDFLITAAPEIAYVQDGRLTYPGAGQFLPFIYNIRDILTCLHVQLYNYGSAIWSHMQTVSGTPTSLKAGTADVIVGLTEMLATGFPIGNTGLTFPDLREDQIAIGILASPSAGGPGHYTSPTEVKKALNYLIKGEKDPSLTYPLQVKDKYPGIRGVMTWSINWDGVFDGRPVTKEFADNYYDYFFGQADTEAPVIASFSCAPNTALANTPVSISATDNRAVTAYYLVADNNTAPASNATGWKSSKPASITLGSVGSHTLYLWVKDASGNISAMASTTVYYDGSVPVISEFSCPGLTSQATVAVTITATDTEGITGYYLVADNSSDPAVDANGWKATKPTSITLSSEGSHTLYLWVKDASGHISTRATAAVHYDVTAPLIGVFSCQPVTNQAIVNVAITATDNVGVTGYYLAANNSAVPGVGAAGWVTNKPTSITLNTQGNYILYLWVKDAGGNISSVATANVVYSASAPVVTLSCPETTTSATVPVTIEGTNMGNITGYYLVADNSATPASGATGWVSNKPTSITLLTEGSHTLYLWVKDAVGNISSTVTANVVYSTITQVVTLACAATSTSATIPVAITATDVNSIAGYYLVADISTTPLPDATGWVVNKPTSIILNTEGTHTLYLWVKDATGKITAAAPVTVSYSSVTATPATTLGIKVAAPTSLRLFSMSPTVTFNLEMEVDAGYQTVNRVYAIIDGTEYNATLISGNRYKISYTTSGFKNYPLKAFVTSTINETGSTPQGQFSLIQLDNCPVSQWLSTISYSQYSLVYNNGKIYKAKYYIGAGTEPQNSTTDYSWEVVGDCNSLVYPVYDCTTVAAWSSSLIYGPNNTNIDVSYNGLVYRAAYYADNSNVPGVSSAWIFKGVCTNLNKKPVVTASFLNTEIQKIPLDAITLEATATDSDGTISSVDFIINGARMTAVKTGDKFAVNWLPEAYGKYNVSVIATDNEMASSTVEGTLIIGASKAPVIGTVYPSNGQKISTVYRVNQDVIKTSAVVTDPDGTISQVTFKINGQSFTGTAASGNTYSFDWVPQGYGEFTAEVSALDNTGTVQKATWSFELINPFSETISTTSLPLQIWANLGASKVFTLNSQVSSVTLRNPGLAKISVSGNTITVDGYRTGRTGLKIVTASGTSYIGLRINASDGTAPGMPDYQSVGFMSEDTPNWDLKFWEQITGDATNTNMDVRYIYINGGPIGSTDNTWRNASRHINFAKNSLKYGLVPYFVFYNIPGGNESYETDLNNAQNPEYMNLYFQDLANFMDDVKGVMNGELFGVILEPDFLGYMQQMAPTFLGTNNPTQIKTAVGENQIATNAGSVSTLVRRINKTINDKRAEGANVFFGWQINLWSSSQEVAANLGVMRNTDPEQKGWNTGRQDVVKAATATINYAISAGITSNGADFVSMDKYGFDAEGYGAGGHLTVDDNAWWFNSDHWNNYLLYAKTVHEVSGKNILLWQLPVGRINGSQYVSARTNTKYADLPNTEKLYEDSSIDYFFGDSFVSTDLKRLAHFSENMAGDSKLSVNGNTITWGSHMDVLKGSGIIHAQFGAGVGASTDGIGFPPEDGYFSIQKIQDYYLGGVDWLPTAPFTSTPLVFANINKVKNLAAIHQDNARNYYGKGCLYTGGFNAKTAGLGDHYLTFVEDEAGRAVYKVQKVTVLNDTEAPIVAQFTGTSPTPVADVDLTISVTDNLGTDGISYFIAQNSTAPEAGASGWTETKPAKYSLVGAEGTYTLYLWAKDESGNISIVKTTTVRYDKGVPVISEFVCPSLTVNFDIPVTTITATDNTGVTGYYLAADNSTTPLAGAAGWVSQKPVSITLSSEGSHMLYLWVKDADGNVSSAKSATVVVDKTKPVISGFSCPATSTSAVIPVTITATDANTVTGYYLVANNSTVPEIGNSGWQLTKPTSITLSGEGSHTLHLWVKDAAGNISVGASAVVIYNESVPEASISCPATSTSATVPVTITATDHVGIAGYYLVADNSAVPAINASNWQVTKPTSITLSGEGSHTLYLWVKNEVGNISVVATATVVYDLGVPVISQFTSVPVTTQAIVNVTITATDNVGITGYYLVADNNTAPVVGASGWQVTKPTSITLSAEGSHSLYLWVKDAAGYISNAASTAVVYDKTLPLIDQFTCPATTGQAEVNVAINATDNVGITGYYLAINNSTTPTYGSDNWLVTKPTSITLPAEGSHTLYLWVKDAVGNISAVRSAAIIYDKTAPQATLSCAATSTMATVSVTVTATDNVGVTGYYLIADNSTIPAIGASNWQVTKPTSITLPAEGSHTLYLWVKDAVGNISAVSSASTVYTLNPGSDLITQEFVLKSGWNIISFNVLPENLDLKVVFQPLISSGKLVKIIDESGKTVQNMGVFGGWRNTIGNLNSSKGYSVNVKSDCTLSVKGEQVPLPLDINLTTGWNIMSYPGHSAQDLKVLFQPLISAGKLKKVMDESGKTLENFGIFGGWKNNIGNLVPGKGYKVNVSGNCTLTIPANGNKSATVLPQLLASSYFKPAFVGNGTDHMSINILDLQASDLLPGDEIGVFDGALCVGSATLGADQWLEGSLCIPASGNDELSETANGFTNGHPVELQLYRANKLYKLNFSKVEGTGFFEKNESLLIQVNMSLSTHIQTTSDQFLFECYPNPFTHEVTIEVRSSKQAEITVDIYDLSGHRIKNLYKGTNSNYLLLKWDGTNDNGSYIPRGVYLCKVNDQVRRLIKLK